ncbi:MAG: sugar phosphate isomerase/epimerase [Planctomycetes bacterium]|nr:sugar phosphate isomerase/epimerase [Planctomycetota bacterium]
MQPAISQVCTLSASFEKDIEEFAAGHCGAIEIWLGKLETYLDSHAPADVLALLAQYSVTAPVASYQGGLLTSTPDARQEHWNLFRKRLALCQQLKIQTLVVACDMSGLVSTEIVTQVHRSLAEAATLAEQHGIRLALEFQAKASLANNLESCAALVSEIGHPALGICFDLFHFHTGPSKTEDLGWLTADNLFHVQICDLAGIPREWAADADRILPGDGDISTAALTERLRQIDYRGLVSVEMMNPQIWQIAPRSVGEIAATALRKVLGQASME